MAANCIALKKRARMFQSESELAEDTNDKVEHSLDHAITPLTEPLSNSEDVILTPHTPKHANISCTNNDFPWDDPVLVAELFESTDRITEQYYSRVRQSQFINLDRENIHIAEITPERICCTFFSTPVEKEVFADIIARVPKTTK
jgi:hypothetical protein